MAKEELKIGEISKPRFEFRNDEGGLEYEAVKSLTTGIL